jgi:hypothetical protein
MTTIKEFLGEKITYDQDSQMIFAVRKDGHCQVIADVRGWGAIQNLFKTAQEAGKFQDELGQFITDAISEKLNN